MTAAESRLTDSRTPERGMDVQESITRLGDPDGYVRERVMEELAAEGDAAVPMLLKLLEHPTPNVRGSAALVLGRIGSVDAVPPLARAAQDLAPGDDRTFCVRALADLARPSLAGEAWLTELFSRLAREPDHFVRPAACPGRRRLRAA